MSLRRVDDGAWQFFFVISIENEFKMKENLWAHDGWKFSVLFFRGFLAGFFLARWVNNKSLTLQPEYSTYSIQCCSRHSSGKHVY